MRSSRFNKRTGVLLLAEATVMFGAIVGAVYLRLGSGGAQDELILRQGYLKAGLATAFCLTAFYFYDLYDFLVMHDRRELVLRLVQALGVTDDLDAIVKREDVDRIVVAMGERRGQFPTDKLLHLSLAGGVSIDPTRVIVSSALSMSSQSLSAKAC